MGRMTQKRPSSGQDRGSSVCSGRWPGVPGLRPQLVPPLSLPSRSPEFLTETGQGPPTTPVPQSQPPPGPRPGQAGPPRCQSLAFWFTFAAFSGAPPTARCLPTPAKIPGPSWLPHTVVVAAAAAAVAGGAGQGEDPGGAQPGQCTRAGRANTGPRQGAREKSFINEKKLLPSWAEMFKPRPQEPRSPARGAACWTSWGWEGRPLLQEGGRLDSSQRWPHPGTEVPGWVPQIQLTFQVGGAAKGPSRGEA